MKAKVSILLAILFSCQANAGLVRTGEQGIREREVLRLRQEEREQQREEANRARREAAMEADAEAKARDVENYNNVVIPEIAKITLAKMIAEGGTDSLSSCALGLNAAMKYRGKESAEKCAAIVEPEFRTIIHRNGFVPKSCEQWAAIKGAPWESAEFDMQYSPLGGKRSPAKFSGELLNSTGQEFLLFAHDQYGPGKNAVIKLLAPTVIINSQTVKVGSGMRGYGVHSGSRTVELVGGRKTTIPVIEAACVAGK